jgi:hypothetical protein
LDVATWAQRRSQWRIAELVAAGRTNQESPYTLFASVGTVE